MVKFSKQLEVQLVPEWRSAYCDYWLLKKELKKVKLQKRMANQTSFNQPSVNYDESTTNLNPNLNPNLSTNGYMSHNSPSLANLARRMNPWNHDLLLKVHETKAEGVKDEVIYETELMKPLVEDEYERGFFKGLDEEFNKVNNFYISKEEEYVERLKTLGKQLDNLIDLQKTVEQQHNNNSLSHRLLSGVAFRRSKDQDPERGEGSGNCHLNNKDEEEEEEEEDSPWYNVNINNNININNNNNNDNNDNDNSEEMLVSMKSDDPLMASSVGSLDLGGSSSSGRSLALLRRSTSSSLKIPNTNASMSLSALSEYLWYDVVKYVQRSKSRSKLSKPSSQSSREELTTSVRKIRYAKKMLRAAFVEFYRGVGLLRSFCTLNLLAFAKILKKHDKLTGLRASLPYLNVVEKAHFNSSDKVTQMMDEVEKRFTDHFAKEDYKRAMMLLRPTQQKPTHAVTFFLGLFTGCSFAIFTALLILLHFGATSKGQITEHYMVSAYPVFSLLFLILLHMFLYGWNVYTWRQVKINYAFIFEFSPKTELRHREILLGCSGLTTLVLAFLLAHLVILFKASENTFNEELIPLSLLLGFIMLLFCPFNIFYRSSRVFFLRSMKQIFFAPLYKVVFADFFLADQLTSQITAFRCVQYIMCYYFGGHFMTHDNDVCASHSFHYLTYLISFLPYWWRFLQCLRRYVNEGDRTQLANGGKYLSAMVAAAARLTYYYSPTDIWLVVFVTASTIATMYQLYWDLIMDWGLLRFDSKLNPWLRDQLILKHKSLYFLSMGLNVVLRFAWLQSVSHMQFGTVDRGLSDLFFASLEVIRRGHWNFYRLENEHLNNVGKYRAVNTVPLPFRDDDYETVEV